MERRITRNNSRSSTPRIENDLDLNLPGLKQHLEDYLKTKTGSPEVRRYLETVKSDDDLLICYLRGRKNKPDVALKTILRYTENRFQNYREIFYPTVPDKRGYLFESHAVGILKNRDKFGRIIVFCDMTKWDPGVTTVNEFTIAGVIQVERLWRLPEVLKNGVILIQNTQGFGLRHARQHTVSHAITVRDIFLHSYPVGVKGFFFFNVPYLFTLMGKVCKPLFSKKMQSRMFLYSTNQEPTELYEMASPDILPTWVGGKLSIEEAAEDVSFYDEH